MRKTKTLLTLGTTTLVLVSAFWLWTNNSTDETKTPVKTNKPHDSNHTVKHGRLKLVTKSPPPSSLTGILNREDILEAAQLVNERVKLPKDVKIVAGGDRDGPYYDPTTATIQFPWSFTAEAHKLLAREQKYRGTELKIATRDAALFVLQHEIAHALIDQLKLPVLGREEDAADTFASLMAVKILKDPDQVIGASDLFAAYDSSIDSETFEEADFFGAHSLDAQRFYAISCHVYGANPRSNKHIIEGLQIDEDRLGECEDEWQLIDRSWSKLLSLKG